MNVLNSRGESALYGLIFQQEEPNESQLGIGDQENIEDVITVALARLGESFPANSIEEVFELF
jgi:hypothetical protein